jgi:hypothetical protein
VTRCVLANCRKPWSRYVKAPLDYEQASATDFMFKNNILHETVEKLVEELGTLVLIELPKSDENHVTK